MTMLSVVIPAYNEEKGILEIMERVLTIREGLKEAGVDEMELLVVNDGSRDRTAEVAGELACKHDCVRIISHPHNRGYGAALKTGFAQAKGELVGFLDADGTYPPEYFPQLCREALNGAELVIGSRMAGADSRMPLTRRLGNVIFATLLSLLGWQRVTDSASGMRVFRKDTLARLSPLPDGLNLTPVMSTRAVHEGIKMVEVAIPYSERVGRSKLSVLRDGRIFLTSMVWTVLSYNPVRVLGIAGLVGVGVAALVGLGLVIARLSGVTALSPWGVFSLFTGLVLGVAGISLFALGATFNYLVSLFYKEPIRQGLFGKPVFKKPLELQFGWMGLVAFAAGLGIGIVSLVLSLSGWEIARLWLYLLGGALASLVGIQLVIYWLLIRVLEDLSQRDVLARADMQVE
ncbi:glycosyltransferase [Longilinea arvoryzae]|uniref:Glycosyltransferase n=1 Tax=Longilinea arvoryzae TaxID=360412 RepID=A0A0S7BH89_9CHLR|nr:glycosyltransferase family 2 protein [Longilinea arvoryzae]GAP13442.1 glycosyltransferase [Longilinea arvoryzae]